MKREAPSESKFEKDTIAKLRSLGKLDLSIVFPGGRYVEVELKKPGQYRLVQQEHLHEFMDGKRCKWCGATALQLKRIEMLVAMDITAFLADTWEGIFEELF